MHLNYEKGLKFKSKTKWGLNRAIKKYLKSMLLAIWFSLSSLSKDIKGPTCIRLVYAHPQGFVSNSTESKWHK